MTVAKKKVFLIEDDEAIADVMQLVLTQAGHRIVAADEDRDFIPQVVQHQPDHILMDLHYRGMQMQKVIQYMQKNEKTAQIPITIVSADADIEQIAKRAQVAGYLKKPFEIDELIALVEK